MRDSRPRRWVVLAALAIFLAGCGDSALEGLDRAHRLARAGKRDLAIQAYQEVLRNHPRNVQALVGLADLFIETGKADQARPLVDQAIALAPQEAGPRYVKGRYLLTKRLWLQAEESLEHATRIDLFDPDAHFYLGLSLEKLGEKEKAVAIFQKVLNLKPDYPGVHARLGYLYFALGATDRSAQELEQATEEQPKNVALVEQLALVYYTLHFNESAERAARRALELNPKSSGAYNILGSAAFARRDVEKARGFFEKAIEIEPGLVAAHANLGAIYNIQGMNDRALAEYQKVIELDPRNVPVRKNLGDFYVTQKRFAEGVAQYREYLKIKHDDAYVAYIAAKIIALTPEGDPEEGIRDMDAFDRATGLDIVKNEIRFAMTTKREEPSGAKLNAMVKDFPYLPDVFAVRAILFERMKNLEDAEETLQMVLLMSLDSDKRAGFQSRLDAYKKGKIPPLPPRLGALPFPLA